MKAVRGATRAAHALFLRISLSLSLRASAAPSIFHSPQQDRASVRGRLGDSWPKLERGCVFPPSPSLPNRARDPPPQKKNEMHV